MRKYYFLIAIFSFALTASFAQTKKYTYESAPNDPLNVRIYTLDNGMKVYLSVNKDKPRIQTFIGVRVGGKNDPAETTGLAHYFEHLMFKGTKSFGTSDYESEKPLLDQIESLFETYRQTKDSLDRKTIYATIDSLSQVAAKISIPNEYDKLMSAIGAQGTNAFTSYDVTAYMEDIPANEIENWAIIQEERFNNPVIRGFHTELETVYEEYNRSLTSDGRKVYEAVMQGLFPHHPYGKQTVLGTQDHLKNPSITNIKNYYNTYYVPNNMAVIMAGDFNPDEVIGIIDNHFGSMKSKPVPQLKTDQEQTITEPIVKEVTGIEAANVSIAFRCPAANTKDAAILEFMDYLLTNGTAGLIDLNLVQKQKVLRAGSSSNPMADYSIFQMYGTPKEGQTLGEVKDLLLGQLDLIKKGEFDEELMQAVINNFRLEQYYQKQEYRYAAQLLLYAFINGTDWKEQVDRIDFQSKLTKKDIVDFSNKYLNDNYVIVYKRQGQPDDKKIDKPVITPIPTNRDSESDFLAKIKSREVNPIEPVFVDYSKDLIISKIKKDVPLLYKQNDTNPLFGLYYVFEMGNDNDRELGTAFRYLSYLGTSTKSAEQIKSELYKLACSFGVQATGDRVYVYVSGLSDNFDKALALLEERLADAKADPEVYNNQVADILKQRADSKLNQSANFNALMTYANWGPKSSFTNIVSEQELKALNPEELVNKTKNLKNLKHKILYYGPLTEKQVVEKLNQNHALGETLKDVPQPVKYEQQTVDKPKVLLANYDSKQLLMSMLHTGAKFDKTIEVERNMYNNYFGGGMNGIVFQEIREARGLAYTAFASYQRPGKPYYAYTLMTYIGTQNDKMKDAIDAFNDILNNMPESEKAFNIAKESILTNIRTGRVIREDVLWNYLDNQEWGYTTDPRIEMFRKIPSLTLKNVKDFQLKYIKDKPLTYCILGNLKDLDMSILEKLGPITTLSQEEIFGY
ncbi:MAG: insulinase family protein [Tannerella sp.]|jgi:predicted Zn-dependent peptidase|nr:insulinase family protein [Tannerella sp.]